jgi:hypothetical protein
MLRATLKSDLRRNRDQNATFRSSLRDGPPLSQLPGTSYRAAFVMSLRDTPRRRPVRRSFRSLRRRSEVGYATRHLLSAICYFSLPTALIFSTKLSITAPPNSSASDSAPSNNFCLAQLFGRRSSVYRDRLDSNSAWGNPSCACLPRLSIGRMRRSVKRFRYRY